MKKSFFLTLCAVFALLSVSGFNAVAQTRTITGTVVEINNEGASIPVAGVVVLVNGQTKGGTTTDDAGHYSVTVPTGKATLLFSCIGYKDQEVSVGTSSKIDVTMEFQSEMLDELVVVGYGVQKRSDVAGSVTTIKSEELATYPATNVAEMMRGKAAGVQISTTSGAPGSQSSIQIRGIRSLLDGSNTPMFVIDGLVATETEFNAVSPDDVESVEILKDAASQAIYGARAANGVVMITTKRGKEERAVVNFNATISSQHLWRNFDFYNGDEYFELRRQAQAHDANIDDPELIALMTPEQVITDAIMEKNYANRNFTDWEKTMFSPALMQQYGLSVRGGSKKIKFSGSVGYTNHKGMVNIGSRYTRGNVRLNMDYEANRWLSLSISSSYIKTANLGAPSSFSSYITMSPLGSVYNEDGSYAQYINSTGDKNPLYNAQYYKKQTDTDIGRLNGYIDIHPLAGFSYRFQFGYYNRFQEVGEYKTKEFTGGGAAGSIKNSKLFHYSIENILNYKVPFKNDDWSLNLTAVQSYEHQPSSDLGFGADTVPIDSFWWNMIADGVNTSMTRSFSEYYLLSWLARAQFSYKDRYILNAAVRFDGSSRFGKNHKWGSFPSVSAAWRISQEPWMKDVKSISNLKIRASYGLVGNQNGIGNYETLGTATDYKYEFGDNFYMGYLPGGSLPNPDLMWESTASANFAVDFGFFKNRLNGTIEYYNTTTNNLLFSRKINNVLGYSNITDNVAKTRTSGVDINIDGAIIRKKNIELNAGITFSAFNNKILRLSGELDDNGVPIDDITNKWFIGQPINVYYQYKTDGIYQYDDFEGKDESGKWVLKDDRKIERTDIVEPGKIKLIDKNGDGKITEADRFIIPRDPKFMGSFNMSLKLYGVELYMDWYGVYGVMKTNAYLSGPNEGGSLQGKNNGIKVNYWTPSNPSNEFPRPSFNSNTSYQSELTLCDASYLRLRTLSLAYALPSNVLRKAHIKGLKLTLTATNLLTFTKYLSYSPETTPGTYPEPRQFAASLNFSF